MSKNEFLHQFFTFSINNNIFIERMKEKTKNNIAKIVTSSVYCNCRHFFSKKLIKINNTHMHGYEYQ